MLLLRGGFIFFAPCDRTDGGLVIEGPCYRGFAHSPAPLSLSLFHPRSALHAPTLPSVSYPIHCPKSTQRKASRHPPPEKKRGQITRKKMLLILGVVAKPRNGVPPPLQLPVLIGLPHIFHEICFHPKMPHIVTKCRRSENCLTFSRRGAGSQSCLIFSRCCCGRNFGSKSRAKMSAQRKRTHPLPKKRLNRPYIRNHPLPHPAFPVPPTETHNFPQETDPQETDSTRNFRFCIFSCNS